MRHNSIGTNNLNKKEGDGENKRNENKQQEETSLQGMPRNSAELSRCRFQGVYAGTPTPTRWLNVVVARKDIQTVSQFDSCHTKIQTAHRLKHDRYISCFFDSGTHHYEAEET